MAMVKLLYLVMTTPMLLPRAHILTMHTHPRTVKHIPNIYFMRVPVAKIYMPEYLMVHIL
jgi:hypothetical protein